MSQFMQIWTNQLVYHLFDEYKENNRSPIDLLAISFDYCTRRAIRYGRQSPKYPSYPWTVFYKFYELGLIPIELYVDIKTTYTTPTLELASVERIVSKAGKCQECGSVWLINAQYIKPFEYGGSGAEQNIGVFCATCSAKLFYANVLSRLFLVLPDDYRPIQIDEAWEPERVAT